MVTRNHFPFRSPSPPRRGEGWGEGAAGWFMGAMRAKVRGDLSSWEKENRLPLRQSREPRSQDQEKVGWPTGFEPATTRSTIWGSNQAELRPPQPGPNLIFVVAHVKLARARCRVVFKTGQKGGL